MLTSHFTYLQTSFCQNTTEVTSVAGISEVAGPSGVTGTPEVTETPGVTVSSTEAIAEWRHVCQEQDEEYEKSLQLDQEKVEVCISMYTVCYFKCNYFFHY